MAKYLNYASGSIENAQIIGEYSCYKDGITQESPATIYMVKDLNKELAEFLKKEITAIAIVEEHFMNYSLIAVPDDYSPEVHLLLTYTKNKFTTFQSYDDYSNFTFKLDMII